MLLYLTLPACRALPADTQTTITCTNLPTHLFDILVMSIIATVVDLLLFIGLTGCHLPDKPWYAQTTGDDDGCEHTVAYVLPDTCYYLPLLLVAHGDPVLLTVGPLWNGRRTHLTWRDYLR